MKRKTAPETGYKREMLPHQNGKGSVRDPMEIYLSDINATKLLTKDQEQKLAKRIANGEPDSRDHMIRANLRLVVKIARDNQGRGLPLEDLIQEGNLGLIRAVEMFDPDRNVRFSTYATYWIKQSVKRGLLNTRRTIRIPAYMELILSKWYHVAARLSDEFGREPAPEEIIADPKLDLSPKKLAIVKNALLIAKGSGLSDSTEEGLLISELLIDTKVKDPRECAIDKETMKRIYELLDEIPEERAKIIKMRYGLDGEEPRILKKIGDKYGFTKERIRQIINEVLEYVELKLGDSLPVILSLHDEKEKEETKSAKKEQLQTA